MKRLAWLVVGALLGSPAPTRAEAPAPTLSTPLHLLKTKHIAVDVKINEQGPFLLVLDTGHGRSYRVEDPEGHRWMFSQ